MAWSIEHHLVIKGNQSGYNHVGINQQITVMQLNNMEEIGKFDVKHIEVRSYSAVISISR